MPFPGRAWPEWNLVTPSKIICLQRKSPLSSKKYAFLPSRSQLRCWLLRPSCQTQPIFRSYYDTICLREFSDYLGNLCSLLDAVLTFKRIARLQPPFALKRRGTFSRATPLLVLVQNVSPHARVLLVFLHVHWLLHHSSQQFDRHYNCRDIYFRC